MLYTGKPFGERKAHRAGAQYRRSGEEKQREGEELKTAVRGKESDNLVGVPPAWK
jgi:hypothetical protein